MAGLMKLIRRKKDSNGDPKEDQGGPSVVAETIEKIALEVDYHGLADLYEAGAWYAKLFWSVIVIGALCAVIHDCYNIIMLFASNPSATKISEISVKSLDLPNVTVCNMGAFNQTELRSRLYEAGEMDIQKQNEFIRYMMIMAYQTPPGNNTLAMDYVHPAKPLWDKMGLAEINYTVSFLRETAYQCENFLSDCEYAENPFNCCDNDIFVYTDLGGCYTIRASNETGPIKQTGRDSASGISVTTVMDVTEIAILEEWKSVGLRLQFGDYVSPFDFSSMLHLPPGMLALVRLSPVRYVLDSSVTECWETEPKLTYHDGYSTGLCKHDCVLKYTVKTCGCMPYGYSTKHAEHHRTCTIEEMRTCVLPKVWNTENGTDPEEIQHCKRKTCLRMCIYWIHEPYLMLSQLRADTNSHNSTKKTNVLNVYFGYMRYTQTEAAQLMTFETFISNLGGAIGLWTGMSLISIVQMLVYGWEGFWRMVERRRAEKMIRTMLAQYPPQNRNPLSEKPVTIKAPVFVKATVQMGGPTSSDPKRPIKPITVPSRTNKINPDASFGGKLKSFFKRNGDIVQPVTHGFDDSPPDPKPRPMSVDGLSQGTLQQETLGTIFEPPPISAENVGSHNVPPWMTTLDDGNVNLEKTKKTKVEFIDDTNNGYSNPQSKVCKVDFVNDAKSGYSNPGSPFSENGTVDGSWTTVDTTTGSSSSTRSGVARPNGRRNSRGAIQGVTTNGNARNGAHFVRKRTQSDNRAKRYPMNRNRY